MTADQPHRRHADDQPGVDVDHLQRLWAPWRHGYLAGSDPVDGCPFCVLPARGAERDRASLILHRGDHAFVILNAYPYNPGHLMVVPYVHCSELAELDEAAAGEVWALGRRCVEVLGDAGRADGVNLGMNLGRAGGAGICDHLHLHAVPRWGGDTNFISVVGAARVLPQALDEVWETFAPAFAAR